MSGELKKIRGLYAIVDNSFTPHLSTVTLAEEFLKGGAKILQLRRKGGQPPVEEARAIAGFKKKYDFIFIMNDFLELAREVNADGYHGGENDPSPREARAFLGKEKIIGHSSHSIEEGIQAEKNGADYVAFGAIFPTKTKGPGHPIQGIDRLTKLCTSVSIPVVAIGGIHRHNFKTTLEAGASSYAMITGLTQAKNIAEEVRWYAKQSS
ncbi:MAG: thiamine phosphate synthase [bacterium]|nr:thiamine phosphate synthase [bacterium]